MSKENIISEPKKVCLCGCGQEVRGYNYTKKQPIRYGHNHQGIGKKRTYDMHAENNPNWKGGRYTTPAGYVFIRKPDHPRADKWGYVLEHIAVIEQKLGRYLSGYEQVHHINKNKQDNRPENLELTTLFEHPKKHTKNMISRQCCDCGRGINEVGRARWCHNPEDRNKMCCLRCYKRRKRD